jgi:hypothetical protein
MPTPSDTPSSVGSDDAVQGEGDYKAGRRYDKAAKDFAESGRVEPAAHDAEPKSEAEAEDMRRAEEAGKSHSKGEDRPGQAGTDLPAGGVNARR